MAPRTGPAWSVVWLAPVPRSAAGRSAVTTTSGTWAVPGLEDGRVQVRDGGARGGHHRDRAVPDALARPSARNPAARSSTRTCSRSSPVRSASRARSASGALRDPGASTTSRTPPASSSVDDHPGAAASASVTRTRGHQRRVCAEPSLPEGSAVGLVARCRGERRSSTATVGGPAGRRRPAPAARSTRSSASRLTGVQPAGVRQLGQRGGQRHPGGAGRSRSPGRWTPRPAARSARRSRRQARTPPSGCTLSTAMSAASSSRDPVGVLGPADRLVGRDRASADRRQPDAQLGQLLDRPARLLDVLEVEAGPARGSRDAAVVHVPAAVGVDPDPPVRTERVADRLDPGQVVGERLAAVGDLDLGRRQPAAARRSRRPAPGPTAGTVQLTGTSVAHRGGPALLGRLVRGPQPGHQLGAGRSRGTGSTRPSPAGPRQTMPCRCGHAAETRRHRDRIAASASLATTSESPPSAVTAGVAARRRT